MNPTEQKTNSEITNENSWSISKVYGAKPSLSNMIITIDVLEDMRKIYPNDYEIIDMIELLREEICKMFGGSIYQYD